MSALGQKQTCADARGLCSLRPIPNVEHVEFAVLDITFAAAQWVVLDPVAISCRGRIE